MEENNSDLQFSQLMHLMEQFVEQQIAEKEPANPEAVVTVNSSREHNSNQRYHVKRFYISASAAGDVTISMGGYSRFSFYVGAGTTEFNIPFTIDRGVAISISSGTLLLVAQVEE